MLTTANSILFVKFTTIYLSLFLVPAPYLHITSSSPMFPLPTCPLRSAPRSIQSCFDTISINPSIWSYKNLAKNHISLSCCCQPLVHTRLPCSVSIDPFISSFMAITLCDTLFTSKIFSASSSFITIPIPFLLPSVVL